jgi:hypothetical protein
MGKHKKSGGSTIQKDGRSRKPSLSVSGYSQSLIDAVMDRHTDNGKKNDDDFDKLMRFVVYKESPNHPVYTENPLSGEEILSIEKACREKPEWAELLTDLQQEYQQILESLEDSSFSRAKLYPPPVRVISKKRFQLFPSLFLPQYGFPRLAAISAATLVVIFGVLAGMSSIMTPRYFDATTIAPMTFTVRGETVLSSGMDAMHRKDYPAALNSFQQIIDTRPLSDEALLASYLIGSIHLMIAPKSYAGLFPSFDPLQVDSGITSLTSAITGIGISGKNNFLEEQCHFLLAKAWLMKQNLPNARQELEHTLQFQGPQKHESTWILSLLPPK